MANKLYGSLTSISLKFRQYFESNLVLPSASLGISNFGLFTGKREVLKTHEEQRNAESALEKFLNKRTASKFYLFVRFLREKYKALGAMDPNVKKLLHGASAQLYFDCANRYPYKTLCKMFGLEDYFSTWFKFTLMHTWMVLFRLHASLDSGAFFKMREEMLMLLWDDISDRLSLVSKEIGINVNTRKDVTKMHGLYIQTLVEYDEGFLTSDTVLAGAIWRCLYIEREFNPVFISAVIRYIRGTIAYLDSLDVDDILVNGIKEWKIAKPYEESIQVASQSKLSK